MRCRTPLRLRTAGLALLATTALAGCGSDDSGGSDADVAQGDVTGQDFADLDPQEIVDAAEAATKEASSIRLSGTTVEDGVERRIDLQADADGTCVGTLEAQGGTAELVGADGSYFFRPDAAFWQATAGAAAQQIIAAVGDKWVANDDLGDVCDLDEALEGDGDDGSTLAVEGTGDVDGQEVVTISKTGGDDDGTASILLDAPHYLVQVEQADGSTIQLSDFGDPVEAQIPSPDEVVDLDELEG